MPAYRTTMVEELARELMLAPTRLRDGYLIAAQSLIELSETQRQYPRSFVVFHLTGYRTRQKSAETIAGADLAADLALLVDQLSLAHPSEWTPNDADHWISAPDLCRRWSISGKTLSRWRDCGLASRWFVASGESARAMYQLSHVAWFEQAHAERVAKASAYRRINTDERRGWAAAAMELVKSRGMTVTEAAREIATRTGRNPETIRLAYRKFSDEIEQSQCGDLTAVGEAAADAAKQSQSDEVHALWSAGAGYASIAATTGLPQREVIRLNTQARAARLAATPIKYIYAAEFDHPNAERQLFGPATHDADPDPLEEPHSPPHAPAGLPPYLRELYNTPLLSAAEERSLFRQMNFWLHRAEQARRLLDVEHGSTAAVDYIDELLSRAAEAKRRIVAANLRLVVSVARKHLGRLPGMDLFDLVSEGNMALMRAAEWFDVSLGNKFSTYATWAIMKQFVRTRNVTRSHGDHYQLAAEAFWHDAPDIDAADVPNTAINACEPTAQENMIDALCDLDPREREIVERRFGLGEHQSQTLVEVSRNMNLSRERVRQIECRTLQKMRRALAERGVRSLNS